MDYLQDLLLRLLTATSFEDEDAKIMVCSICGARESPPGQVIHNPSSICGEVQDVLENTSGIPTRLKPVNSLKIYNLKDVVGKLGLSNTSPSAYNNYIYEDPVYGNPIIKQLQSTNCEWCGSFDLGSKDGCCTVCGRRRTV